MSFAHYLGDIKMVQVPDPFGMGISIHAPEVKTMSKVYGIMFLQKPTPLETQNGGTYKLLTAQPIYVVAPDDKSAVAEAAIKSAENFPGVPPGLLEARVTSIT